jgi:hypothetical protein
MQEFLERMGAGCKGEYTLGSLLFKPIAPGALTVPVSGGDVAKGYLRQDDRVVHYLRPDHPVPFFENFEDQLEIFFPYLRHLHR